MKTLILVFVAVAIVFTASAAELPNIKNSIVVPQKTQPAAASAKAIVSEYRQGQFSLAGFGSYRVHEFGAMDGRFGGGAEVGYFLKDNISLNFETITEDAGHSAIDEVGLNFKGFLPIKKTGFAPYILLGATYVTETDSEVTTTTHSGGGKHPDKTTETTEVIDQRSWRMNAGAGVQLKRGNIFAFADGRWVNDFDTIGHALFRVGGGLSF